MLSLLKAAIEAEAATRAANAGTTTAPPVPDPEEARRRQDLVRGMRTLAAPTKEEQAATTAAGPPSATVATPILELYHLRTRLVPSDLPPDVILLIAFF
ncbi:unnamed protein product [Aureobasidium pullulans]|nr:unnamed protein product [Aureobasidium pullulans]